MINTLKLMIGNKLYSKQLIPKKLVRALFKKVKITWTLNLLWSTIIFPHEFASIDF